MGRYCRQKKVVAFGNSIRKIREETMLKAVNAVKLPLIGSYVGKKLLEKIEKFEPMQITVDEASGLIKNMERNRLGCLKSSKKRESYACKGKE